MASPPQQEPQPLRWPRWLAGLAIVVYLAQAVPWLSSRWVEDESWYSSVGYALHTEGRIRNPLFPDGDPESRVDPRPPAMPITLAATFKVLGVGAADARTPSVLAGLGLIVATYGLGSVLAAPAVGAVAALFVATDTWVILSARTVRPEIYTAFFSVLAILLHFLCRRRNSVWLALLSGLAIGVAINYHVNGVPALAVMLLFLIEYGWKALRDRRFWATLAGVILLALPTAIWLRSSPDHVKAFQRVYGRGKNISVKKFMLQETARYSDFIGLSNKRFRLPIQAPVRLHIVLLILGAWAVLFWYNRKLAVTLLVLILPSPLLWMTEMNPAARFFAVPSALFGVTIAAALMTQKERRWQLASAAVALVIVSQLAGNAFFLSTARKADYEAVREGLQKLIPRDAGVYGAITFWMALHDQKYYSYNRTPLTEAVGPLGVDYLILNDRVLLQGSGYWEDSFAKLREETNAYVRDQATLIGKVPNSFYGDLEIYRVNRPAAASPAK